MTDKEKREVREEKILQELKKRCPGAEVGFYNRYKTNDVKERIVHLRNPKSNTGLHLTEPKEDDQVDDMLSVAVSAYENLSEDDFQEVEQFAEYYIARQSLFVYLLDPDKNRHYLKNAVTAPYIEGLVKVYALRVRKEGREGMTLVTKDLMDTWGRTIPEIDRDAMDGLRLIGCFAEPIEEHLRKMVAEMLGYETKIEPGIHLEQGYPRLSVCSTVTHFKGAGVIMLPEIRKGLYEKIGKYYILPSSINEVIILPKTEDVTLNDINSLKDMVQDINGNKVAPDEVLSDRVYEYDPLYDRIRVAGWTEGGRA